MSSVIVGAGMFLLCLRLAAILSLFPCNLLTRCFIGPAHAVYFATYEAVKHAMGGNQAGVHHPLAAGKFLLLPSIVRPLLD